MATGLEGQDALNPNEMNDDFQVMSRPNAAQAPAAFDERAGRATMMNGVSAPSGDGPRLSNVLDLDGETRPDDRAMGQQQPSQASQRPDLPMSSGEETARTFLLGPGGEARASSEVPAPPPSPKPKRGPAALLGGMAKAVQSLPAAVEGLVMGQGSQATTRQTARSTDVEGYASAQSGSPEYVRRQTADAPPPATPLLDERTLRRLNEMPGAAPHLYQPEQPTSGLKPPSTTSSDIQNEVELLVSENQMLQRERPEACLAFSDWLHSTRPALADVSDSSEQLWQAVLDESSAWYAQRWKRWCSRMSELGGTLPDCSLQLKALEKMSRTALQAHPDIAFRVNLTRAALQVDTNPDDLKIGQLHAQILAELEALGHRTSKDDKAKDSQTGTPPKIKGVEQTELLKVDLHLGYLAAKDLSQQQIKTMLADAAAILQQASPAGNGQQTPVMAVPISPCPQAPSSTGGAPTSPTAQASPANPVQGTPITLAALNAQIESLRSLARDYEVKMIAIGHEANKAMAKDDVHVKALLDSGATHAVVPFRNGMTGLERVPVTLAGDQREEWFKTDGGLPKSSVETHLPPQGSVEPCQKPEEQQPHATALPEEDELAEYEPSLPSDPEDWDPLADFDSGAKAIKVGEKDGHPNEEGEPPAEAQEEDWLRDVELDEQLTDLTSGVELVSLRFMVGLKTKSGPDVTTGVQKMILEISRMYPVRVLHCDPGTEFGSDRLSSWLAQQGVRLQTTVPTDKQANGVAERGVGWLKARARTLLSATGLAAAYWPLAMRYAAESHNRQVLKWITASYAAPHLTIPEGHVLVTAEGRSLQCHKGRFQVKVLQVQKRFLEVEEDVERDPEALAKGANLDQDFTEENSKPGMCLEPSAMEVAVHRDYRNEWGTKKKPAEQVQPRWDSEEDKEYLTSSGFVLPDLPFLTPEVKEDIQEDSHTIPIGWDPTGETGPNMPQENLEEMDLYEFLEDREVEWTMKRLTFMGVESLADLAYLYVEDLVELGLPLEDARRIMTGIHPTGTVRPDNPNMISLTTGEVCLFDRGQRQIPRVIQNRTLGYHAPGPPVLGLGINTQAAPDDPIPYLEDWQELNGYRQPEPVLPPERDPVDLTGPRDEREEPPEVSAVLHVDGNLASQWVPSSSSGSLQGSVTGLASQHVTAFDSNAYSMHSMWMQSIWDAQSQEEFDALVDWQPPRQQGAAPPGNETTVDQVDEYRCNMLQHVDWEPKPPLSRNSRRTGELPSLDSPSLATPVPEIGVSIPSTVSALVSMDPPPRSAELDVEDPRISKVEETSYTKDIESLLEKLTGIEEGKRENFFSNLTLRIVSCGNYAKEVSEEVLYASGAAAESLRILLILAGRSTVPVPKDWVKDQPPEEREIQLADALTKALPAPRLNDLSEMLGLGLPPSADPAVQAVMTTARAFNHLDPTEGQSVLLILALMMTQVVPAASQDDEEVEGVSLDLYFVAAMLAPSLEITLWQPCVQQMMKAATAGKEGPEATPPIEEEERVHHPFSLALPFPLMDFPHLDLHGGYIRAASAAELAADARKDLAPEELRPLAMATLLQARGLTACGDAAAQAEAADSVQLFRRLGDRIGEAHATHVLALATALGGTASAYEDAFVWGVGLWV
ncbi:GIP [Symbiodinium sp. CCMP2592]|nr:GIP [Symbiodinium sp. CCMP2592]